MLGDIVNSREFCDFDTEVIHTVFHLIPRVLVYQSSSGNAQMDWTSLSSSGMSSKIAGLLHFHLCIANHHERIIPVTDAGVRLLPQPSLHQLNHHLHRRNH